MIQGTEREAELRADQHEALENQRWSGPLVWSVRLFMWGLSLSRATHLVGRVSRRLRLDVPQLSEIDVPVAGLPPGLVGCRLGHLSDIHIGPHVRPAEAMRAIELLNAAAPDLIVFTGDLVDHRPRDVVPAAQVMAGLRAPFGVFGVLGNHDHRVGKIRLLAALSEHAPQIQMLVNGASRVTLPGGELWLAGVDSVYLDRADLTAALGKVPANAPCLLLTHEPDVVDHLPRSVLLTLAGHAHGGQIRLGRRPLLLPPLGRRYHSGLNYSPNGAVHTSRGVGWTGLPLRLNCPPEVTVLRLVAATPVP